MNRGSLTADIDTVMYSCGIESLHPGGLAKSEEMALACGAAADKIILDVGSGKGSTACFLAEKYNCRVTGIDQSDSMIRHSNNRSATAGLSEHVSFRKAELLYLPFGGESFDIVLIECVTTLVDKNKAFEEVLRVLKPGGYFGDLEMIWQKPPPDEAAEHLKRLWGGFETETLPGWTGFYSSAGLEEVSAVDFSSMMPEMGRDLVRQLGVAGVIRLAGKLLGRPPLLRSMLEYRKAFNRYNQYIGYAYFTGRKPV